MEFFFILPSDRKFYALSDGVLINEGKILHIGKKVIFWNIICVLLFKSCENDQIFKFTDYILIFQNSEDVLN